MTETELRFWEDAVANATQGPWETGDPYDQRTKEPLGVYGMGMEVADAQTVRDATFIAASREAMPALIAEVRRLRVLTDGLKENIGLLRGSTVAGWCAECKGSGSIITHLGSEGSNTVATRKCVCGGNPFLRNATAEFWLEER